ncbi:MAG: hypothetical protein EOO96_24815 [Pedobacter sp.]|nr:MAG: hypothetical protein EOO96_24815 [Pedobacter sp.]
MKKILILLLTSSLFLVSACSKDFLSVDAIVEKNCTGTYLKFDTKFSYVCNSDILASYTNGQSVSVSYKALEGCNSIGSAVCSVAFTYEDVIEIKEILKR